MIRAKRDHLQKWLASWTHLPAQGSAEWLAQRGLSCGGSELKKLLSNEEEFVKSKCGLSPMTSNLAMIWGSVFECISRKFSSIIFDAPIYESGSITSAEHCRKTYSLDGIGLVRMRVIVDGRAMYGWFYVLFEYKSLWSRVPVYGKVFPDYIPQVKSGLADLVLPELAIYMENTVRICNLKQLKAADANYNTKVHANKSYVPLAHGYIIVRGREENRDYGDIDTQMDLYQLLSDIKAGVLTIELGSIAICTAALLGKSQFLRAQEQKIKTISHAKMIEELRGKIADKKNLAGVIPYKIMDTNIVPVEKEVGYTAKYSQEIDEAMDKVDELQKIEDIEERLNHFSRIYSTQSSPLDCDF